LAQVTQDESHGRQLKEPFADREKPYSQMHLPLPPTGVAAFVKQVVQSVSRGPKQF